MHSCCGVEYLRFNPLGKNLVRGYSKLHSVLNNARDCISQVVNKSEVFSHCNGRFGIPVIHYECIT